MGGAPRAWLGTSATASFQQDGRRTGNGPRRGERGTGERDLAGEQEPGRDAGDVEQENGIWQENRNRDAARGDGEQEDGIWQENRNRDAARGDGEQENGIWQANRNRDAARGTGNRRTGFGRRTEKRRGGKEGRTRGPAHE